MLPRRYRNDAKGAVLVDFSTIKRLLYCRKCEAAGIRYGRSSIRNGSQNKDGITVV